MHKTVVLYLMAFSFFGNALAQDTDADGIPDAFETVFGLNPLDPADATLDPDGDTVLNLGEFQQSTDPTRPDTDLDGVGDQADPTPLDRAVQYWGDPQLSSGDELTYVWPTWFNGAGKHGGAWTNNAWLATGRKISARIDGLPGADESLFLLYDNTVVSNDLVATIHYSDHPDAGLHVSLFDAGMNLQALDIAGNLITGGGGEASREILIPVTEYPMASIIAIHRSAGTAEVHRSTLELLPPRRRSQTITLPVFPNHSATTYCDDNGPFIRLAPNDPAEPTLDVDLTFNPYIPVGTVTPCQTDSDQDALPNLWEIANGTDPAVADCVEVVGESGTITITQAAANVWHTLTFSRTYDQPVVLMQSPSNADPDPVFVRVRNTGSASCEFQLTEWAYQDGVHGAENVSYLVVEAGPHLFPDGTLLEAGQVTARTNYRTFNFQTSFPLPPVVLTQLASLNDPLPAIVRQRNITTNSFRCKLQLEEALAGTNHANEAVSYLAITPGPKSIFGKQMEAGSTPDAVRHTPHAFTFAAPFAAPPVFLSNARSADGGDPAALRVDALDANGATVHIDEEQSANAEQNHTTEAVDFLALEPGPLVLRHLASGHIDSDCDSLPDTWETTYFGTLGYGPDDDPDNDGYTNAEELPASTNPNEFTDSCPAPIGEIGMACIKSGVTNTIPFRLTYNTPVVIARSLSSQERDPAIPRVTPTSVGFEISLDEFAYQDGTHAEELVSYLVVEAGRHQLHDGRELEAGRIVVTAQTNHRYQASFPTPPAVFAQVNAPAEAEPILERVWNTYRARFTIRLDEAEAPETPGRPPETVHYIAIETGTTTTVEGPMTVAVTPGLGDETDTPLQFPAAYPSRPVFIVQKDSNRSQDPVRARFHQLSRDGAIVRLSEEQSRDNETNHGTVPVAWLAAPRGLLYNNQWSICTGPGGTSPFADPDADGLFGDQEQFAGTNPSLPDTDGDGYNDATEVSFGSNPLDPVDLPTDHLRLELFQPSTTCCW